jgi:urea carboxylase
MTTTLLVANRGEIAVRIIKTARRLGMRTVAVFSDADRAAPHVRLADKAVRLESARSYLSVPAMLAAADGVDLVHPGYGFLSEDAGFARTLADAGLTFVGPSVENLELFGAKHTARAAASAAGVPLLAGTGLLSTVDEAVAAAERIGFPVMLKASGGGGGIGMRACHDVAGLIAAWSQVERLAATHFGSAGVFLERLVERARHVEVQVFGDGAGRVLAAGNRDCTLQRRHQKVVEECPSGLPGVESLASYAVDLCAKVNYLSAGTVEFVYDMDRGEFAFLEVNTRLQVEHPVTEAVFRIDLVEWMLQLAAGESLDVFDNHPQAAGHAVEARVYAEDPGRDHQPSAGLVTAVGFPAGVRVDGWIEPGIEVTPHFDPLLAKVIATGPNRSEALARLGGALADSRIDGIQTNLGLLRAAVADPRVLADEHDTSTLDSVRDPEPRIDVIRPGTLTTVQDWPGRTGFWHVGVPPSGPMDDLSFRLGNIAVGNDPGTAGLECTLDGPALTVGAAATICVTGAPVEVTVNGHSVPQWEPVEVSAGSTVDIGVLGGPGLRAYLLVAGGIDVPDLLGSKATFTLGLFGGHGGRALRTGDVLRPGVARGVPAPVPVDQRPRLSSHWEIGALEGPHAAPDFFTVEDIKTFYATDWEVHFNSARTGVRLVGPRPAWARPDGGEAGLHPSNIHDTPYSVAAVDYTGDMPILLGPDGPSLGGFVCPATVAVAQRWKLGQLRPGDTVRFVPVDEDHAASLRRGADLLRSREDHADGGVLRRLPETDDRPAVTYRRAGDDNLLVEYGPMQLDLALRMRVHALAERLSAARLPLIDLTPGIRSLQIHVDPDRLPITRLLDLVGDIEADLPATGELSVPSRQIRLPLSWDDPATREAIARYTAGVRDDAPWCPWNIEFIRRINGLSTVDDVHRTVFDASYLVLGLGDVYLGAPVATPLDPRHRLVTTKYNPARTWTAENSVGIGGAYLCIYGMEGPGGYQLVGRTVQVWSRWHQRGPFEPGSPWLLRFFDRISWYPVAAADLLDLRADLAAGRLDLDITGGEFAIADHQRFLADNAADIARFRVTQTAAFAAEREAWRRAGEFDPKPEPMPARSSVAAPPGGQLVEAPFVATVWRIDVRPGDRVAAGQPLLALEAMKMESVVASPADGQVVDVVVRPGDLVTPGSTLVVLDAA